MDDGYISLRLRDGDSPEVPSSAGALNDDFEDDEEVDEYDETVPECVTADEAGPTSQEPKAQEPTLPGASHDPAFRSGNLPAANKNPTVAGQELSQKSNYDYGCTRLLTTYP